MNAFLKAAFRFLWKYRHEIAAVVLPLLKKILKRMKDARDKKRGQVPQKTT